MNRRAPVALAFGALAFGALALATAGCGTSAQAAPSAKPGAQTTVTSALTTASQTSRSSTTTPAPTTSPTTMPTSPNATTSADYGSVDRSNATAVAEAAITANWTSNTTTDAGPFVATLRSLIWFAPAAAAKVRSHPPTGPAGAQWSTWAAHRATTTVATVLDPDAGAPPDTPTAAYRSFEVTVTAHGQAGWTAPASHYQCFVTLTRTSASAPWQVAVFEVAQ